MSKTHIFALTGLSGSGKDSAASVLVDACSFVRLAFADALYAEIAEAFNVERATLENREAKETPVPYLALRHCQHLGFIGAAAVSAARPELETSRQAMAEFLDQPRSAREILQLWGTEYRRRQNPAYWTRIVVEKVATLRRGGMHHFIITDVRFPNEAQSVRLMGGKLWQVTRPGVAPVNPHASETDGAQFAPDCVIANDGDLQALRVKVLRAYWEAETGLSACELGAAGA